MMLQDIRIQKLTAQYLDQFAELFVEAFNHHMGVLQKWGFRQRVDFFKYVELFDCGPDTNHYIALKQEEVVGIVILANSKDIVAKNYSLTRYLEAIKKYGLTNILKLATVALLMKHEIGSDECYLDTLVIKKEYRGQGLGTQLLAFGEQIGRGNPRYKQYTIRVVADNIKARRVYENYGFKPIEWTHSYVLERLTAIKGFVLLTKPIE